MFFFFSFFFLYLMKCHGMQDYLGKHWRSTYYPKLSPEVMSEQSILKISLYVYIGPSWIAFENRQNHEF